MACRPRRNGQFTWSERTRLWRRQAFPPLQFFKGYVFIRRFGLPSAVNLNADQAAHRNILFVFGVIDSQNSVQPKADMRAFTTNDVLIPIVGLDDVLQDCRMG